MGTRCVVTFKDSNGEHHVYKHWDGYPDGIKPLIEQAKSRAWPLPRFEADEFATAFVCVAKPKEGGGDVRLLKGAFPGDIEYHYVVTCKSGRLHVAAKYLC